jgi:hypothetical protein
LKKIKIEKQKNKNTERKENELECFKRIKASEIQLSIGLYPEKLHKTLTNPATIEIDRVTAKILLNPLIQKTLLEFKTKIDVDQLEKFLKRNEKHVQKSSIKKIVNEVQKGKGIKRGNEKVSSNEGAEKKSSGKNKNEPRKLVKATSKDEESESENSEEEIGNSKFVDPFFVSTNGQNYLAAVNASEKVSDNSDSDNDRSKNEDGKRKYQKATKRKLNVKPVGRKIALEKLNVTPPKFELPAVENVIEESKAPEQNLHPSWVAKQKMKSIQEFKGTKIKFDD